MGVLRFGVGRCYRCLADQIRCRRHTTLDGVFPYEPIHRDQTPIRIANRRESYVGHADSFVGIRHIAVFNLGKVSDVFVGSIAALTAKKRGGLFQKHRRIFRTIRPHIRYQSALIQLLTQVHRLFGRIMESRTGGLEKPRCRERNGRRFRRFFRRPHREPVFKHLGFRQKRFDFFGSRVAAIERKLDRLLEEIAGRVVFGLEDACFVFHVVFVDEPESRGLASSRRESIGFVVVDVFP